MKPTPPPSSHLPIQKSELLTSELVSDIHSLINAAQAGLAATVNSALTMLYWRIGTRIHTEVLQGERAA